MADPLLSFESFANMVFAAAIALVQFQNCRLRKIANIRRKTPLAFIVVAIFWTIMYAYISAGQPALSNLCQFMGVGSTCPQNWFGETFVRPGFLFTLAVMLSQSIQELQFAAAVVKMQKEEDVPK